MQKEMGQVALRYRLADMAHVMVEKISLNESVALFVSIWGVVQDMVYHSFKLISI